jgi:hypothetical protein
MAPSTRKLLIAFGVLLVITAIWSTMERRRTTRQTTSFGRVDTEDVTQIELSGKGNAVVLKKEGDRWMVTDPVHYPADQASVENLLEKVDELAVTNIVASNPTNHDVYEVGPDTGVLVRLMGGRNNDQRLLTFYVGKLTSDFSHTYVREFGSDDVQTATGLLQGYFSKTVGAWRDRTIMALPVEEVVRVSVASEPANWTLARRGVIPGAPDAAWVMQVDGEIVAADSSRCAAVARVAATLRATDFPSPGQITDAGWDSVMVRVDIELSSGDRTGFTAVPLPGDNSRYWIRKDGDDTVFIIYRSTLDSLTRPRDYLEATP